MAKLTVTPNVSRWTQGPVRDGLPVYPDDVWHLAEGGDLPGRVWFRLAEADDGKFICTELSIEATAPLTTSAMRKVPMSLVVETLLKRRWTADDLGGGLHLGHGLREWYDDPRLLTDLPPADLQKLVLVNAKKPVKARTKPRRGREGPSAEHLERFRIAYEWARANAPRRPVAAAAERANISPATAHRWLKLLREGRS